MRTLVLTNDQHSALKALLDLVVDTEVGEAMRRDIEAMGHDDEAWMEALDATHVAVEQSSPAFHAVVQALTKRFVEEPAEDQAEALLEALPGRTLEQAHAVWMDVADTFWYDDNTPE